MVSIFRSPPRFARACNFQSLHLAALAQFNTLLMS
jgi:hypothetical protein